MICPRCGSNNTHTQVTIETKEYRKGHSCLWWILIGWWWRLLWFIVFGIWYVIYRIIIGLIPNAKITNEYVHHICNNCGYTWK